MNTADYFNVDSDAVVFGAIPKTVWHIFFFQKSSLKIEMYINLTYFIHFGHK